MAEKTGGGEKVGSIYYEVTLDTQKLIDGQRQVDAAVGNVGAKLTETAHAAKAYAHQAGMASKYTKEFEAQAKKLNMTVGELKNANRILPAQFTDIAVSLAAGQHPMTVFLQQGGQLKDMYGGVGPALRAMAGYIAGLVNPFTAAAAAAGVFMFGLVKGGQEFQEVNRTLELSGYRAGVTAEHLMVLATAMDRMAGVTQGQAAEALNAFISLGVKGSEHLQRFTEAALELERVGGPSVQETAKAFAELEKKPLEASIKLQEATGFLTKEIYEQVKALEEAGNKTEAARVAQDAFADAINSRTPEIADKLGTIERGWLAIKDAVREAGDAILAIGRDTKQKQLDSLVSQRDFAVNTGSGDATINALDAQIAAVEKLLNADTERAQQQAATIKAADAAVAQDKARAMFADRYATSQERASKEIEAARKAGVLTPELEGRINERHKEKPKANRRFDAGVYLEDLRGKAAPTDTARAESEAAEASKRNKKMLADGLLSKSQAAEAEVLIEERKQLRITEINAKVAEELEKKQADLAKKQADHLKKMTEVADPIAALQTEYEQKLALVTEYEGLMAQAGVDATLLAEQSKTQITAEYEQQRAALAEQTFKSQGEAQAFLMDSIDALGQAATSSIVGLIDGTMTAQDVMRSLARTVLNEAVGSLVQIGMQQLKNAIIAKTTSMATATVQKAAIATTTAAQVAATGTMAATSVAAAGAVTAAAAPAAVAMSMATLGKAALIGGAAFLATMALAKSFGGGRQYGGPVSADKMYRVNETGQPEMFTAANGQQFMMPNTRGEVTAANKIGGGGKVQVSVNVVNNHSGAGVSVNQRDDGRVVEITINEIANQINNNSGPVWSAMRSSTNIEGRM